jgi:hypothetical protein
MSKKNTELLIISNKGQAISNTNYWESNSCQSGLFFLSWNAGAGRLLIPDIHKSSIKDMESADYVIVSRGTLEGHDALELLFEDHSDTPLSIHIAMDQTDRIIPDSDQGAEFVITGWTKEEVKFRLPGKYRTVGDLPDLSPWSAH